MQKRRLESTYTTGFKVIFAQAYKIIYSVTKHVYGFLIIRVTLFY